MAIGGGDVGWSVESDQADREADSPWVSFLSAGSLSWLILVT